MSIVSGWWKYSIMVNAAHLCIGAFYQQVVCIMGTVKPYKSVAKPNASLVIHKCWVGVVCQ